MAFAVAAMIVLTTITRMMENQRLQMGTLKALGFPGRQIRNHYMCYALYPSLLGSLLGLFVGRHTLPMCRSAHESGRGDRKCGYTSVLTRRSAETR